MCQTWFTNGKRGLLRKKMVNSLKFVSWNLVSYNLKISDLKMFFFFLFVKSIFLGYHFPLYTPPPISIHTISLTKISGSTHNQNHHQMSAKSV